MSEYLVHYGVKGMKWGKRKQLPVDSSLDRKANRASDYAKESIGETYDNYGNMTKLQRKSFRRDAKIVGANAVRKVLGRVFDRRGAAVNKHAARANTKITKALAKEASRVDSEQNFLRKARKSGQKIDWVYDKNGVARPIVVGQRKK